ncbi:MAG TPA: hypothetical protein VF230_06100 [Acidimicrobiales bacterium]
MHTEPLRRLLPLPIAEVAGVAAALAAVLAERHDRGEAHGGISLDTVLVGNGRVDLSPPPATLHEGTIAPSAPDDVAALGRVVTAALAAWPLATDAGAGGAGEALAAVAAEARRAAVVGAPTAADLVARFATAVQGARLPRPRIVPTKQHPPAYRPRHSQARVASRARSGALLAGWLGVLAITIAVLTPAGGMLAAPPVFDGLAACAGWAASRAPEVAFVALLRVVVLSLAWYLLATTVVDLACRAARFTRAASLADALTAPSLRKLVHGTVGASVAAGALVVTTDTAPAPRRPAASAELRANAAPPSTTTTATSAPTTTSTTTVARPATPPQPSVPVPPPPASPEREWVIAPGEHLWYVAERVVTEAWGERPTDVELVPYWAALVDANRDRLADRDNPDLVFAGQSVRIPEPPPSRGATTR